MLRYLTTSGSNKGSSKPASRPSSAANLAEADALELSYQKWIKNQLEKRIVEYCDLQPINIFCGTWNVNAKSLPDNYDLSAWLHPDNIDIPTADLYVLGLQEIVDLNVVNVVMVSSTSDEVSSSWTLKIAEFLGKSSLNYELLLERHLVGLQLVVFARKSLVPNITDIRSSVTGTGGMGVLGNKGGISIRMDIFDTPICFVCAHFHANRDNVESRNADFHTLLESTILSPASMLQTLSRKSVLEDKFRISPYLQRENLNSRIEEVHENEDGTPCKDFRILNHEHVFWLGDLNYRVGEEISTQDVFNITNKGDWAGLITHDQLNLERVRGNVFEGFEEGTINFPPTYKYQPGTDIYESRPDKKIRAPAWCDRILWRTTSQDRVRLESYTRCALNLSDHKPVRAIFSCDARKLSVSRLKVLYQQLLFSVDKWLNASTPKLAVENRIIDFGLVKQQEIPHKALIEVKNIGTTIAEWSFVPTPDQDPHSPICKPWLKVQPSRGIIAPDEVILIEISTHLPIDVMFGLVTAGQKSLEEILILRVNKGNDFFCIINASLDETEFPGIISSYEEKEAAISRVQQHIAERKASIVSEANSNGKSCISETVTSPMAESSKPTSTSSTSVPPPIPPRPPQPPMSPQEKDKSANSSPYNSPLERGTSFRLMESASNAAAMFQKSLTADAPPPAEEAEVDMADIYGSPDDD